MGGSEGSEDNGMKEPSRRHPAIMADGWVVVSPRALSSTGQQETDRITAGELPVRSNLSVQRLSRLRGLLCDA